MFNLNDLDASGLIAIQEEKPAVTKDNKEMKNKESAENKCFFMLSPPLL